jgi:hypothetical protein
VAPLLQSGQGQVPTRPNVSSNSGGSTEAVMLGKVEEYNRAKGREQEGAHVPCTSAVIVIAIVHLLFVSFMLCFPLLRLAGMS